MLSRTTQFKIAAALLPVFLLVLIELFLRLFNLYPQIPLFIDKSSGQIQVNPIVGERYFNRNEIPVPNLYPQTFRADKQPGSFRIFCLGGSTTAGFPYEQTVPFPTQLDFMLTAAYPERSFEVINLGLSAINSFTVLDWIPEVIEQDPDLLIIYMGHNEFYGAYGTGATISLGNSGGITRFILSLQRFHLVQLLNSIRNQLTASKSDGPSPTIMDRIVAEKFIGADSELRTITARNFAENMEIILDHCWDNDTPVIISNLVSNLKNQPPLDKTGAEDGPTSAGHHYYQGIDKIASADTVGALASFTEAVRLDGIPFRAGPAINQVITSRAEHFDLPLVDMQAVFRQNSPGSIPGNTLFCDHLHPNPNGYRLMAREIFQKIVNSGLLPPIPANQVVGSAPDYVTPLDWEIGALRIFRLKQHWPFSEPTTNYLPVESEQSARIARDFLFRHHVWGRAHDEMADHYLTDGQLRKACAEYEAILAVYPHQSDFYAKLVDCARRAGLWDKAESACRQALEVVSDKGLFYYNLAIAQRMDGRLRQALQTIQLAIDFPGLTRQEFTEYYFTMAVILSDMNRNADAVLILNSVLKETPSFQPACSLLNKLQNR